MIIDCHAHLSLMAEGETYEDAKQKLLNPMKENGVERTLIIADNIANSGCANLETLMRYCREDESTLIIGAINPFQHTDESVSRVEELLRENRIVGLKIFPGHDLLYPTDERFNSTYQLCLRHSKPLMVHTGINPGNEKSARYNDPKYIVEIAKRFPDLKIVISHYFWPEMNYCYSMTRTRGLENIYFDTSALADGTVIATCGGVERIGEVS